jgi:hypothetical protein
VSQTDVERPVQICLRARDILDVSGTGQCSRRDQSLEIVQSLDVNKKNRNRPACNGLRPKRCHPGIDKLYSIRFQAHKKAFTPSVCLNHEVSNNRFPPQQLHWLRSHLQGPERQLHHGHLAIEVAVLRQYPQLINF